jgi:LmbE family N-acetylglucosaminyl deacetylase
MAAQPRRHDGARGGTAAPTQGAAAIVESEAAAPVPSEAAHDWRPERFMVIVAHPDDADFGPAATVATWIAAGSVAWLVCCTSGDAGSEDAELDPLVLAATREAEQRAAAEVIGYEGVSFLHQPDGALENDLALRELLVREIRAFRPDAIITTDPEVVFRKGRGVNHTDHRAAGMAAVDAVFPAARNPMSFPGLVREGLLPHRVRRLYLSGSNQPTVRVDVSAQLDRKLEALSRHVSQIGNDAQAIDNVRRRAAEEGAVIGVPAAEAFRLVGIDPDEAPPA